jgi:hypothetical protein
MKETDVKTMLMIALEIGARIMQLVLTKLAHMSANVQVAFLEIFARPKFHFAPVRNSLPAKMVANVSIISHITLANVFPDFLAKIAPKTSMTVLITCAR